MTLVLESVNLIAAAAHLTMAVLLIVMSQRMKLGYPRLMVVLALLFLVGALDRLAAPDPVLGYSPLLDALTDTAIILLFIPLVIDSGRLARGIFASLDAAAFSKREYERAKRHYSQLMRHRIANPLTVIKGAAETLQHGVGAESDRVQLLGAITDAAADLEQVSLHPDPIGDEERELQGRPRVGP